MFSLSIQRGVRSLAFLASVASWSLLASVYLVACEARLSAIQQKCASDDDCRKGFLCDLGTSRCEAATGGKCTEGQIECSRMEGACRSGIRRCVLGAWSECSGVMPVRETCNSADDDCDGSVDEDFKDLGATCSQGRGACLVSSVIACRGDGNGTECLAAANPPSPETCNGIDDDCDGLVDFPIASAPACPLTQGVCAGSKQSCVGASLSACTAENYGPNYDASDSEQSCDGLDNDCDGSVDENYSVRVNDIRISEVVACPIQAWCDGSSCGTGAVVVGGNGVPFDGVPGVVDLTANVGNHVWVELHNQRSCELPLVSLELWAGPPGSLTSQTLDASNVFRADGSPCTSLAPNDYCLAKAPTALLGADSVGFNRRVELRRASVLVDSFDIADPSGCEPSCRVLSTRRSGVSPCCDQEAYVRTDANVSRGMATPFAPASIALEYTPALATEVVISEVLAARSSLDVNGDGSAVVSEDDFVEVAALQNVSLGRAYIEHNASGTVQRVHDFACFVPLSAGARVAVFGGASAGLGRGAQMASAGSAAFDLPLQTAFTVRLRDRSAQELSSAVLTNVDFAPTGPAQSRVSCGLGENDLQSSCACYCSQQPAACLPQCEGTCEVAAVSSAGCFSPGSRPRDGVVGGR